jgi:hypothetical protein
MPSTLRQETRTFRPLQYKFLAVPGSKVKPGLRQGGTRSVIQPRNLSYHNNPYETLPDIPLLTQNLPVSCIAFQGGPADSSTTSQNTTEGTP